MNDDTATSNKLLEQSLEAAFEGKSAAIESFFKALIDGPLFVPDRYQAQPMSDSPKYPNDFINVLGIQDNDRVVVPVFSEPELIESWSGNKLRWHKTDGKSIANQLPDGWWLVVNPGSSVEKELTPWELSRIKDGHHSIQELVHEAMGDIEVEPLNIRPVEADELLETKECLKEFARNDERISSIYLLAEVGEDTAGAEVTTALIGAVLFPEVENKDFEAVKKSIEDAVSPTLIGGQPKKVFVGHDVQQSVMLGVFKDSEPVIEKSTKTKSILSVISDLFNRKADK